MKQNTIKTVLSAIFALSAIGLGVGLTQGCKTTTTINNDGSTNVVTTVDPVKTSALIEVVIAAGVPFVVEKDTNAIPYLRLAAVVFKTAANEGNYDPAQVSVALDKISVKELRGPQAKALANAILGAYRAAFGDAVRANLDKTQWAIPVLNAVADGLTAALPAPGDSSPL